MEKPLYEAAIDCLAAIYRSSFPSILSYKNTTWRLRDYDHAALLAEADLFLDWYAKDFGREIKGPAREDWNQIWAGLFKSFEAHAPGLALRDFHAENIFWLPERQAIERVGLIDYQDALIVHPAYDLVSLLEDARRDVSKDIVDPLLKRFCEKSGIKYDETFLTTYAIMGAQRNAKVLGFPVRADLKYGKPQYRVLLPRIAAHFRGNLDHPALSGLKVWVQENVPEVYND